MHPRGGLGDRDIFLLFLLGLQQVVQKSNAQGIVVCILVADLGLEGARAGPRSPPYGTIFSLESVDAPVQASAVVLVLVRGSRHVGRLERGEKGGGLAGSGSGSVFGGVCRGGE